MSAGLKFSVKIITRSKRIICFATGSSQYQCVPIRRNSTQTDVNYTAYNHDPATYGMQKFA